MPILEDRLGIKKLEDKVAMEVSVDARDKASLVKLQAKIDYLKALTEELWQLGVEMEPMVAYTEARTKLVKDQQAVLRGDCFADV
jgi:hypothetical protein